MGNLGNFEDNKADMGFGGEFLSYAGDAQTNPSLGNEWASQVSTPAATFDKTKYAAKPFDVTKIPTRARVIPADINIGTSTTPTTSINEATTNTTTDGGGAIGGGSAADTSSEPTAASGMSNTKKALIIGGSLVAIFIGLKALKIV